MSASVDRHSGPSYLAISPPNPLVGTYLLWLSKADVISVEELRMPSKTAFPPPPSPATAQVSETGIYYQNYEARFVVEETGD